MFKQPLSNVTKILYHQPWSLLVKVLYSTSFVYYSVEKALSKQKLRNDKLEQLIGQGFWLLLGLVLMQLWQQLCPVVLENQGLF